MRIATRFVPLILVECIALLAGYAARIVFPGKSYGVERKIRGLFWGLRFGARGLVIGPRVQFEGENFTLGDNVKLFDGGQYVTAAAGYIRIGKNTHVSRLSIVSGLGGISIGEGCAISAHVAIYSVTADTNAPIVADAETQKGPVTIGDNVYIGVGAKIIPGVTVGDNAVIAAGAVVTKDIPPNTLAKGVPATHSPLIKRRSE
ncbi:MAG: acyltransferase [Erythrobacter sp.]